MPRSATAVYGFEGIVLHLSAYGEAHRLVEVLGCESGRLTVIARGARASRRRFAGVLELFAQLGLQVHPGKRNALGTLVAAELIQARAGIRRSLAQISRASALCACVRHLCPEHQAAPETFALLRLALDYVAANDVARAAGAYPRLAQAAGIMPDLNRCGRCSTKQTPLALVPHQAIVLCARCANGRPAMSPQLHAALCGARVTHTAVAGAVEQAVIGWTVVHSGRPLQLLPQGGLS